MQRKPLSSLVVEDCEACKNFLGAPIPSFTGPKRPRSSGRWRPFAPEGLSLDSQAYAVRVIRAPFAWLVEVRYLAGNPWSAVYEPATIVRESAVQVHRALTADLWARVRRRLDARCEVAPAMSSMASAKKRGDLHDESWQWRAARAAILLMGDSGLRRVEAAQARREDLRPSELASIAKTARRRSGDREATGAPEASGQNADRNSASRERAVWTLTIVGKRRKQRTVPFSGATVDALRAHWQDRTRDFDTRPSGALIAPTSIPGTDAAKTRHSVDDNDVPYTSDALGHLVRMAIKRLVNELRADSIALSEPSTGDLVQLVNTSAHAFRHTFGTRAVARDMPTDVVQAILGHASLQTTSIYVKAEKRRMLEAAARYYQDDDA